MFHVMLVLIPILFFVIVISILLFSITTIIAGLIGGTATTLLVKNKVYKRLLLSVFVF